jgi:hypothetical protein
LTLRELLWMADGHACDRWQRTAALCAVIANANRSKKQRVFQITDFLPKTMRPTTIQPDEPDRQGLAMVRAALEAGRK